MPQRTRHERAAAVIWRWRPSQEEGSVAARGRRRGLVRGAVGLGVAVLLGLWKPVVGAVAAVLAVALLAVALASPGGLYPRVERWLAAFARSVAVAVSWLTLTVVHVFVFLPLGLLLRATGRLRITRALDPEATTYWRPADVSGGGPRSHERQF
jgi:hypothetical protein